MAFQFALNRMFVVTANLGTLFDKVSPNNVNPSAAEKLFIASVRATCCLDSLVCRLCV